VRHADRHLAQSYVLRSHRLAEVAGAIAYLASPTAGSTTGTWLAADGGMAGLRLWI